MSKNIIFIFCFLYYFNCNGQVKNNELKFSQVGWTLLIPENSELLTSKQLESLFDATKNKTDINLELSQNEVLFVIRKNEYNYFGSSLTAFDSTSFESWEDSYAYYKKIVVDLIQSNKSEISLLDTASSIENIDGLIFQKFYMKTRYPKHNITLENYWYYRKQNNLEFSINITFSDKEIGSKYLGLLKASKFDK